LHGGSAPGVSTLIAAAIDDGVGIVALTNVDNKATILQKIVLALVQKAVGAGGPFSISPANNSVTSRSISPRHASAGVIARADDTGATFYPDPSGTYCSAGYGTIVLCNLRSTSTACEGVLNDVRAAIDVISPNPPDLFTYWGGVWYKHFQFVYTNGSSYAVLSGEIYPQGYGKNSTPFTTLSPYTTAKFVVENGEVVGFGFDDDDDNPVLPVKPGTVKEISQVWFDRKD
jgi:hypothetical protein